jgi:hypothetical protein
LCVRAAEPERVDRIVDVVSLVPIESGETERVLMWSGWIRSVAGISRASAAGADG